MSLFAMYTVGWIYYRIPRNSHSMYISRLSMEPGFSKLKFCGWRLSKSFCSLLHDYIQIIYPTLSSEIDKASHQIVYHSRGNLPRPPCGTQVLGISTVAGGRVQVDRWHHALLKNNVQMHEMTRSIRSTVLPYFLKLTA